MNESLRPNEDHSHASVGTENVSLQVSGGLNFRLDQGFTFLVYFFAAVTVTILNCHDSSHFQRSSLRIFGNG